MDTASLCPTSAPSPPSSSGPTAPWTGRRSEVAWKDNLEMNRTTVRRLCWLAAAICFGVLLIPEVRRSQTAEEQRTSLKMGLPFSPWFHFEDEHIEKKQDNGGVSSSSMSVRTSYGVEFVSWSALSMLLGIGFLIAAKYAGRRPIPATGRPDS